MQLHPGTRVSEALTKPRWLAFGLAACGAVASTRGGEAGVVFVPNGAEAIESSLYRAAPTAGQRDKEQIRLTPGPHLFIDDFLIERTSGLKRRVNCPIRDPRIPNPLITGKEDGCVAPYLTVVRDPESQRFRIWYDTYKQEKVGYSAIVATMQSEDGIHWIRPHRLIENLNIFNASVIDEGPAHPKQSERYKLSWWIDEGLKLFVSADGTEWTRAASQPVLRRTPGAVVNVGDIHNIFRDPVRSRYMATFGIYTTGPTWAGNRRVTLQSTSSDLIHWERPWYVLTPDDSTDPGQTQFYMMSGYVFRGDLIIGLVKILRDDVQAPGTPAGAFGIGYTSLAWSRDGRHWVRDQAPFFEPDPSPAAWDHAHAWMDFQLPVGDEVYIYYGGYRYGHKMDPQEGRQIGMVRMQRDRYVSRDAGPEGGALLTRLLTLAGDRITVNAKIDGELRVRLRDRAGNPVLGFDAADCHPVRGDSLAHPVEWPVSPAALRDRPVSIEFLLTDGQLYGFDLVD